MSIFKGEAHRHLINCSKYAADYDSELTKLRSELLRRGYPESALRPVTYDYERRHDCLSKLARRDTRRVECKSFTDAPLVLKVHFSQDMCKLNLKRRIGELLERPRERIGQTFLSPCRIMICYLTQRSNFMHSYAWNFLLGQRTGKSMGRGG